jgi:hypothetical protein
MNQTTNEVFKNHFNISSNRINEPKVDIFISIIRKNIKRSLSSSIIKNAFPNYYKKAKENSRFYEENTKGYLSTNPNKNAYMNSSVCSTSFNYVLPDPESYDLSNYQSIKRKKSSSSLEPQKSNFRNSLYKNQYSPIKSIDLRPNPKTELIKNNYIKLKGYNSYSQYSPNKSFHKNKENSKRFTKYLVHDMLQPTYKQDFEREQTREATKLIEKKYQYSNENKQKMTIPKSR